MSREHRRHRHLHLGGGWVAPLCPAQFAAPDPGWTAQDTDQGPAADGGTAGAAGDAGAST